jgi:hypothetical protein
LLEILWKVKIISAREFQHGFSKTTEALKPGESLTILKRGKPLGIFTKLPKRRIKTPDFWANLKNASYSEKLGDKILQEFDDSVS